MPRQKIGLLLYPGCLPAGLLASQDLLLAANLRAQRQLFEPILVAPTSAPVRCAHGLALTPTASIEQDLDTLIVPGFWAESAIHIAAALADQRALIAMLAKLPARTNVLSYCTGVSVLAKAGLLRGQRATATWWLSSYLQQNFPDTDWQCQREIVHCGRVATASGVHGHLLLAQSLVREKLTPSRYLELKQLMVLARPEPVLPALQALDLIEQAGPLLRAVTQWVERAPADRCDMKTIAAGLKLSERTLARQVRAATTHTPAPRARP